MESVGSTSPLFEVLKDVGGCRSYSDVEVRSSSGSTSQTHRLLLAAISPTLASVIAEVPQDTPLLVILPDACEWSVNLLMQLIHLDTHTGEKHSITSVELLQLLQLLGVACENYLSPIPESTVKGEKPSAEGRETLTSSFLDSKQCVSGLNDSITFAGSECSSKLDVSALETDDSGNDTDDKTMAFARRLLSKKTKKSFAKKKKPISVRDARFECPRCHVRVPSRTVLRRHLNKAHGDGRFKCDRCTFTSNLYKSLWRHRSAHDGAGKTGKAAQCELCQKKFANETGLFAHNCPDKDGRLSADSQSEKPVSKNEMQTFPVQQSTVKTEPIGADVTSSSKRTKSYHLTTDNKVTSLDKTSSSKRTKAVAKTPKSDDDDASLECTRCRVRFPSRRALSKHLNKSHGDGRFKCDRCTFTSNLDASLVRHKSVVHDGPAKAGRCELCQKKFFSKTNLFTHNCPVADSQVAAADDDQSKKPISNDKVKVQQVAAVKNEPVGAAVTSPAAVSSCQQCDVSFASHRQLISHTKAKHTGTAHGRFQCDKCADCFRQKWSLHRHSLIVHEKRFDYPCALCEKRYATEANLNYHIRQVHLKKKLFRCADCAAAFQTRVELIEHQRTHTGEKPFTCNLCSRDFASHRTMFAHVRGACPMRPRLVKRIRDRVSCDLCGRTMSCKNNVEYHKKFNCLKRPEIMSKLDSIQLSRLAPSEGDSSESSPVTTVASFKCTFCQACFASEDRLARHLTYKHAQGTLKCNECSFSCNEKRPLRLHMERRHQAAERPFECAVCQKRFWTKSSLHLHSAVHSQTRDFACEHCGATFRTKVALDRHTVIHTGEKPYVCPSCGRGFSQSSPLKTHRRSHKH